MKCRVEIFLESEITHEKYSILSTPHGTILGALSEVIPQATDQKDIMVRGEHICILLEELFNAGNR